MTHGWVPTDLRASTEEWLVAVTIATEVPPKPTKSQNATTSFTAEMIPKAIRAVAEVIKNRSVGVSPLSVVLKPRQFSGVMRGVPAAALGHRDIWLEAVTGGWIPEHVQRCLSEWRRVNAGEGAKTVPGVTHYYSPVGMLPPTRVPTWAEAMTEVTLAGVAPDYFKWFKP